MFTYSQCWKNNDIEKHLKNMFKNDASVTSVCDVNKEHF